MGRIEWRHGRPVAWLFGITVVLPALALAVLAYRALDSDRQLAEQVWREHLQDATRRAYADLERKTLEVRGRAEAIARGERPADGTGEVVISPVLEVARNSPFAWVPDGRMPSIELPAELEAAERLEMRGGAAEAAYRQLLSRVSAAWQGWVHLRLSRVHSRTGKTEAARQELKQAAEGQHAASAFAARFELATGSAEAAAALYGELMAGRWVIEKSPYAFYEERLREWAGGKIGRELLAKAARREAASRLLERTLDGETGWLKDEAAGAFIVRATQARTAAVLVGEQQWRMWFEDFAKSGARDVAVRLQAGKGMSLAAMGLPWGIVAEARDPDAAAQANTGRRRLLLGILLLVGGVLVFGSLATVRLVRRELRIAQLQSDFAATVSHEFRSPLTGIRQLAEMLLAGRAAEDEGRRRRYYELISKECDRLTRLVENVLDFSRMEDGRKEYRVGRIETGEWLRELAGVAEQRRRVDVDLEAELPAVEGDRESLSSAVLNLLDNAIKYSQEDQPVRLQAHVSDGWLQIAVSDAGCGIEAAERKRIFDRFYRGSKAESGAAKGVGLGLALVKRIADTHGARVGVKSELGKGSTFTLSLKVAG
jgi:signal transduction histidine kinase